MSRLISVDLHADFGFLKKPDTNDPMYFTFNMLHKPALIGILGAILGEKGFYDDEKLSKSKGKGRSASTVYETGVKPEYYQKLESLKVGIKPLNDEKGVFVKDAIQYNNGTGFASEEQGGNLIVKEQLLIKPSYRCFILLSKMDETEKKLFDFLKGNLAEYLPYLGKNDFSVWWNNFDEYDYDLFKPDDKSFKIDSVFIKEELIKEGKELAPRLKLFGSLDTSQFIYFENLPVEYDTYLWQYKYQSFAYSNISFKSEYQVDSLFEVKSRSSDEKYIIQLF